MNRTEFKAEAKKQGLTVKQLIKLSMLKSEVYHQIKFDGKPNHSDTAIELNDTIYFDERRMGPFRKLADAGYITMDRSSVTVTGKGWAVPCNAGAAVFIGGADDSDITDGPNPNSPISWFGVAEEIAA